MEKCRRNSPDIPSVSHSLLLVMFRVKVCVPVVGIDPLSQRSMNYGLDYIGGKGHLISQKQHDRCMQLQSPHYPQERHASLSID